MTSRLVLVDANVLLNFALIDRLDLLGALPDLDFRAPAEVAPRAPPGLKIPG